MSQPLPPSDRRTAPPHGLDADEREFAAFAEAQDRLDLEAVTWAVRQRDGLDAQGQAELRAWLSADARHAGALAEMSTTLGHVRQSPGVAAALRTAGARAEAGSAPEGLRPGSERDEPSIKRVGTCGHERRACAESHRWWQRLGPLLPQATAAAIAFALVGGGWLGWERWTHWQQSPRFEQAYATQRGQQLAVTLPDAGTRGSTLHLDTATQVDVRLYRDRREVRLDEGQALFAVHADAQRPFHVQAGALRITVLGTRFSVRHTRTGLDAGRTVVSVEEGRVHVTRIGPTETDRELPEGRGAGLGTAVELTAGQRVTADEGGALGPVAEVTPAAIAPWRDGRISFEQMPLAQAIAEFERYGCTGLVVRDPAVAALPVGGSYSLRQFRRFHEVLPQVLPVRLLPHGEWTEVVAR